VLSVCAGIFLWSSQCFGVDALDKTKELQALAEKEVQAAVSVYREQGVAPALERIEQGYLLFENTTKKRQMSDAYHKRVWKEAQVLSGRQDEAWGLALWTYLFQRRHTRLTISEERLITLDYGLISNLVGTGFNLGKLADMRKWTRLLERNLEAQHGLDLSGKSYPDLGPIFSFLPDARQRAFPTRYQHLKKDPFPNRAAKCLDSFYLYAVCSVADSYLAEGDWVRATELNQWFIDYTRECIKTPEQVPYPSEVVSFSLRCSMSLAEICGLHGHPGEGVKVLDNFLEIADRYKRTGKKDILIARLERELLYIELGRMSNDACETADKALASVGNNLWNYSRWEDFNVALERARIYYEAGQKAVAWEIVNQLLELGKKDINPRHRIRILRMAIELALLDSGTHPELESWLKEALMNERKLGNKPAEIWLYEKYSRFLVLQGRYREADAIQREVVRLARAMKLPDRLSAASETLAQIREKLPVQQAIPDFTADIQPRNSETMVMTGTAGFSRFYLVNESAQDCSGILEISGPVTNVFQVASSVIVAAVSPSLPSNILNPSITLKAGAQCIIDLKGAPLGSEEVAKVIFSWIPTGASKPSTSAAWTYHAGETVQRATVVDAHELHQNPFYLIPIYHTLQRSVTNVADTIDVMVEASEPVRIELYDAQTFELVSIDANGDGDFDDEGDLVASDKNGNLHPDLTLPVGRQLYSFLLYVAPVHGAKGPKTISLAISVLQGEKWIVDSVDKVVFK